MLPWCPLGLARWAWGSCPRVIRILCCVTLARRPRLVQRRGNHSRLNLWSSACIVRDSGFLRNAILQTGSMLVKANCTDRERSRWCAGRRTPSLASTHQIVVESRNSEHVFASVRGIIEIPHFDHGLDARLRIVASHAFAL
jgi:hypothetical protein